MLFGETGRVLEDMPALETVSVDPENQSYADENNLLMSKDKTILYATLYTIEELVVPASVEVIYSDACWNRYNLKRVIFEGNALQEIRRSAFGNNYYFSEIIFNGTQEEWDAVDKEGLPHIYTDYTVTCTQS